MNAHREAPPVQIAAAQIEEREERRAQAARSGLLGRLGGRRSDSAACSSGRDALAITALYVAVSVAWMAISDALLGRPAASGLEQPALLVQRGGYLVVTGFVLLGFLRRMLHRQYLAHQAVQRTALESELLLNALDDFVFVLGPNGRYEYVAGALAQRFPETARKPLGLTPSEAIGQRVGGFMETARRRVLNGERVTFSWAMSAEADGQVRVAPLSHFRVTLMPLREADGSIQRVIGVARDTSRERVMEMQSVEAQDRLRWLAGHDDLTGLINRSLLSERMHHLLEWAHRFERPLAVHFIDLDRFQDINDALGQHAGDELLREVARRLRDLARPGDLVGRVSGDQFAFVQADTGARSAQEFAERMVAMLRMPKSVGGNAITLTASVGTALALRDGGQVETLFACADMAMHEAKARGGNQALAYGISMGERVQRRVRIGRELLDALASDEVELWYQPIAEPDGTTIIGAEALLRWQHPELGPIGALEIVEAAENAGLAADLGRWVIDSTVRQGAQWHRAGWPLTVHANLGGDELRLSSFVDDTLAALDRHGLPPHALVLEVTERQLITDFEAASEALGRLRSAGVGVASDDFGTGYSMLNYLRRLPLSTLKISQEFIEHVMESERDCLITRASIALGHEMGLTVIAEGVETEDHLEFVRAAGADLFQGFLLSPAVPPCELIGLLEPAGPIAQAA